MKGGEIALENQEGSGKPKVKDSSWFRESRRVFDSGFEGEGRWVQVVNRVLEESEKRNSWSLESYRSRNRSWR